MSNDKSTLSKDSLYLLNSKSNLSVLDNKSNISINEYFNCLFCFSTVESPMMCPYCSKFACNKCFKIWVEENKSECPHCKSYLEYDSLIKVTVFSDIYNSLKTFFEKNKKSKNSFCSLHKKSELLYFCKTCNIETCGDCAILGDHKSHEIVKIDEIINNQIEKIKIEMKKISSKIENIICILKNNKEKEKKIVVLKQSKVKEIDEFCKNLKSNIEKDYWAKFSELKEIKSNLKQEKYIYEKNFSNIKKLLDKYYSNNVKFSIRNILSTLNNLNNKSIENNKSISYDFGIDKNFNPLIGEFTLKKFCNLKDKGDIIFSDIFEMDGIKWRLKIYPNGTGKYLGKYLSVFVEMLFGFEEGSYYYKVIMISNNKKIQQHLEKDFVSEFSSNVSWGYNRFYNIKNLKLNEFLNDNDEIKFKFIIKSSNFNQKIIDLKNYNKFLKQKLNNINNNNDNNIDNIVNNKNLVSFNSVEDDNVSNNSNNDYPNNSSNNLNSNSKNISLEDKYHSVENETSEIIINNNDKSLINSKTNSENIIFMDIIDNDNSKKENFEIDFNRNSWNELDLNTNNSTDNII